MLVTLNATGYIINPCDTFTVVWSQISGPAVTLSSTTSLSPTFNTNGVGTYLFQVIGTDNRGNTAISQTTVTVTNT